MMKLKDYKLIIIILLGVQTMFAQQKITGYVKSQETNAPIAAAKIYDAQTGLITTTDRQGFFEFTLEKTQLKLLVFTYEYEVFQVEINQNTKTPLEIFLKDLSVNLSEVEIIARKSKVFELSRLKDVEETGIYAGKKTEVILVDQSMANLATNNARQIYSQVAGLNIYQNDDAGLQLNIGGRGLNPNRTSNFNTRQNQYDISADVLGYPESYYSPASEALEEIQIIRGAASLQYGTQFGGLINFKLKQPNPNKQLDIETRNTLGSFDLYTNFTSFSGTKGRWRYYAYSNYKQGNGFRPNSNFESINLYGHLGYKIDENTSVSGELTYMNYLAQQAGGLTDNMFNENPYQSNRSRNWFEVDWLLYNLKFKKKFSKDTNFSFSLFGLNAQRNALGFRTNRVDQVDPGEERDLIKGKFRNYGFEARFLSTHRLLGKKSTYVVGTKLYNANNLEQQGPGSAGSGPDFSFKTERYPNYQNQIDFSLPNFNWSAFGENMININDQFTVTPGFRFEYIKTEADGSFKNINLDGAGNVILNETIEDQREFERSFVLLGLGLSYKPSSALELYTNLSQNYRSVTYSDIYTANPAFAIDDGITDEKGYTADLGLRGKIKKVLSYDLSAFALAYNNRIGFVSTVNSGSRPISLRTNVGDALIYGVETLVDFNLKSILNFNNNYRFNLFVNTSVISSEYLTSEETGIEGKKVEFVPELNLKTGLRFAYKDLMASLQYTYLGEQFTDATNSVGANISGVIGQIPAYDILDLSLSYKYKKFKLETGINNVLDHAYFTRRATGYPGPGIIPSAPRNWYTTLEIKF